MHVWLLARQSSAAAVAVAVAVLCVAASAQGSGQPSDAVVGRPLSEALRALQSAGLRIVFSTAIVTPDLRVRETPRATSPRQRLDQLLAPHGLVARDGPAGTIQIVRVVKPAAGPGTSPTSGPAAFQPASRKPPNEPLLLSGHREHVVVKEPLPYGIERVPAPATSLSRDDIEQLQGHLADDPVRAAHAFPGAWAADDFRTEFAVRGSPARHLGIVIDGASATQLRHTAPGRGNAGSLGMLTSHVLDGVTLHAGAYPRKYADTLGAQLELTLREGSRADFHLRGAISGTNAVLLGEGPIGPSSRGSWLVAARQSFIGWPNGGLGTPRSAFGFSDAVAKVVYDVGPRQQLGVSVVSGLSSVDGEDALDGGEGPDGTNRATMANLSWRSTFGAALVISQRAYVVRQQYSDGLEPSAQGDRGTHDEMVYRVTAFRPVSKGLVEAGAQIARTDVTATQWSRGGISTASWTRSGYAHLSWPVTPTLRVMPGLRVTGSTQVSGAMVSPWLLADWEFRRGWTISGSTGMSHQEPSFYATNRVLSDVPLRPERARHVDVGIEHRLSDAVRWRVTAFNRLERDVWSPGDFGSTAAALDGNLGPSSTDVAGGWLGGSASGLELVIDRRSRGGLTGWVAYSYGKARQTDTQTGDTFWSDADQRHAVSVLGAYRFSARSGVGLTFRAGSNVPIPGAFLARDGRLFVSTSRNQVRLPRYARLDLRAHRGVDRFGLRMTAYAEVLNLLNRSNLGPANGTVDPQTGEAIGFTDTLISRRLMGGLAFAF